MKEACCGIMQSYEARNAEYFLIMTTMIIMRRRLENRVTDSR